jgi:hypothetical protein
MHRMITATHSGHFPIADTTVTANAVIAKITNTVSILFLPYFLFFSSKILFSCFIMIIRAIRMPITPIHIAVIIILLYFLTSSGAVSVCTVTVLSFVSVGGAVGVLTPLINAAIAPTEIAIMLAAFTSTPSPCATILPVHKATSADTPNSVSVLNIAHLRFRCCCWGRA